MRDKLIDSIRLVPYSLRMVALVLVFNGIFTLIRLSTILIGNAVGLDWRIANIVIGFGLLMKRRVWYLTACISVVVSAVLHVRAVAMVLADYQAFGVGGILYFFVALVLDLGMLFILLRHLISKNLYSAKGRP